MINPINGLEPENPVKEKRTEKVSIPDVDVALPEVEPQQPTESTND